MRSSLPDVFCKKGVLRNFTKFTRKRSCQNLFFNKVAGQTCNFVKKRDSGTSFSCEFCEISKNTFLHRTPLVAASANSVPTTQTKKLILNHLKEIGSNFDSFSSNYGDLILLGDCNSDPNEPALKIKQLVSI